ncbi:hypothetical protein CYMTET_36325 [Cymbomonas tetramitiformis]|uniref:Uncharacterized protein n=1 Tax=Cymbomonas tetramitiformis TaxID=36881 RepID=A0AAE0CHP8_9CHLO|nr:hypothetical protein CYMTET_36325 [Cymbomonas tetramitiformis]
METCDNGTDFEAQRAKKIAENKRRMLELGLLSLAADLKPAKREKCTPKTPTQMPETQQPARQSARCLPHPVRAIFLPLHVATLDLDSPSNKTIPRVACTSTSSWFTNDVIAAGKREDFRSAWCGEKVLVTVAGVFEQVHPSKDLLLSWNAFHLATVKMDSL